MWPHPDLGRTGSGAPGQSEPGTPPSCPWRQSGRRGSTASSAAAWCSAPASIARGVITGIVVRSSDYQHSSWGTWAWHSSKLLTEAISNIAAPGAASRHCYQTEYLQQLLGLYACSAAQATGMSSVGVKMACVCLSDPGGMRLGHHSWTPADAYGPTRRGTYTVLLT